MASPNIPRTNTTASWTDATGTTHANFEVLEKRARKLSDDELVFIRDDCKKAAKSMPEGHKAGFYLDHAIICGDEIMRRMKKNIWRS